MVTGSAAGHARKRTKILFGRGVCEVLRGSRVELCPGARHAAALSAFWRSTHPPRNISEVVCLLDFCASGGEIGGVANGGAGGRSRNSVTVGGAQCRCLASRERLTENEKSKKRSGPRLTT